tara:strand:+ start:964 stop:1125 length:162 start_codon:yes stop_codon:yes gene_type:complete
MWFMVYKSLRKSTEIGFYFKLDPAKIENLQFMKCFFSIFLLLRAIINELMFFL